MRIPLKIIFLSLVGFLGLNKGFSQDFDDSQLPGRLGERVQAMKVAFITNKLSLTPEQAQQFWPIYNQYQKQETQLKRNFRNGKNINLMSDEEVEQHIDQRFALEEKLLNLKKNCYQELKNVISIRQIANIAKTENEFKAVLLKEIQKHRRQRGQNDDR